MTSETQVLSTIVLFLQCEDEMPTNFLLSPGAVFFWKCHLCLSSISKQNIMLGFSFSLLLERSSLVEQLPLLPKQLDSDDCFYNFKGVKLSRFVSQSIL